ncbi:uncharacterized protein LOC103102612 isoform X2 [Monodelphis domestica]|uniref:uncharacterized protein LOC103102612 isoform X2 n=1 Tax=Monodelphis domestica TaxID=13616 RepID=UPI00044348B0|nr:uncharacterized protein LOC103102612 isoform X2 [Monodelphis domestica]
MSDGDGKTIDGNYIKPGRCWNYEALLQSKDAYKELKSSPMTGEASQTVPEKKNDKLSTKGKKEHSSKRKKRGKRSLNKSDKMQRLSAFEIPVVVRLPGLKVAKSKSSKPRIPAWPCPKENELQVATYLAALQNKIEQTYTEPRLVPNRPKEAQANEDEQIEIISLYEEDEIEKKIVLPGPCRSWDDLFTNKGKPSRLSDVSLSITSLIQQLALDKVVEINIDDLLDDTKEVSPTPAWMDVSPTPSQASLQQNKVSAVTKDLFRNGREGQNKHTSAPPMYPAQKTTFSSFHKKEPVFQMGKKQPSSLTSFGLELQAKMPPPDRNCRRTRNFLSVTKQFAEKESELYKFQSQQESDFSPTTSPFIRKKELCSGFMCVVNAWTVSQPVPTMQDGNLLPEKIFMPQKPRRTTFNKTFK